MAFTTEELALKQAVKAAQNKMNDILYAFKGNFTTIENLSDIKYNFIDKTGKIYDSTKTYTAGDIITYDFYTYVSLISNNINNTPFLSPTAWIKVETNTCLKGEVFAAVLCNCYSPTPYNLSTFYIESSYNMNYISFLGNNMIEFKFADSLALSDNNYLVLIGGFNLGGGYYSGDSLNHSYFNIISKTKTGFIIKTPTNYSVGYTHGTISIAVIPLQNEDFQI